MILGLIIATMTHILNIFKIDNLFYFLSINYIFLENYKIYNISIALNLIKNYNKN